MIFFSFCLSNSQNPLIFIYVLNSGIVTLTY